MECIKGQNVEELRRALEKDAGGDIQTLEGLEGLLMNYIPSLKSISDELRTNLHTLWDIDETGGAVNMFLNAITGSANINVRLVTQEKWDESASVEESYDVQSECTHEESENLSSGHGIGQVESRTTGSYWQEYYPKGLFNVLKLRIKDPEVLIYAPITAVPFYIELKYKVLSFIDSQYYKAIIPILLHPNTKFGHWVGVVIEQVDANELCIKYFDSENLPIPSALKEALHSLRGIVVNFERKSVETQWYHNNCGSELIENIAEEIEGWRVSQGDAASLHSWLVAKHLMMTHQEVIYLAILPIHSSDVGTLSSSIALITMGSKPYTSFVLRIGISIDKMIQKIQPFVYEAVIGLRVLNSAVDSMRLVNEPTIENIKKALFDIAYLYGLYHHGVNSYYIAMSAAEALHQLCQGEHYQALKQVATTGFYMSVQYVINIPYVGFLYIGAITAYTGYAVIVNSYSLYQEYMSEESELKSAAAYRHVFKLMSESLLQHIYDFDDSVRSYESRINNLMASFEKTLVKTPLEEKNEFDHKLYEYILLQEELSKMEAEGLKAKRFKIDLGEQNYGDCVEAKNITSSAMGEEHYYCYNEEKEILTHISIVQ